MNESLWSVAVDAPLLQTLTYSIPFSEPSPDDLRGRSVLVPLGRRQAHGVLLSPSPATDASIQVKPVETLLEDRPRLHGAFLSWLEWLSRYYAHPIGQVMELAFPPLKKGGRTRKAAVVEEVLATPPPTLTDEQETVHQAIAQNPGFGVHLIYGVTGSGKTEVYLRLIHDTLKRGKRAIVLVPEISLTPQLVQRFAARFGHQIAVIHSHLTEREKTNQWWEIVDGKKQILIGARSALFCPVPDLGLIVVDEEHEASFKQEEKLKYHARDAAVMLGKHLNCPVILGSATPSMESWRNATEGRYQLHRMSKRVENRPMPNIEVIDLRAERQLLREDKKNIRDLPFWLSERLYLAIEDTLAKGDQAALFLNRRGMAQTILCGDCGAVRECPNCAISLTLHAHTHLVCHYCGYHENRTEICPTCLIGEPKPLGMGTELIEQDLQKLFPSKKIARADRDEIQTREEMEELIRSVETRKVDILVGTQMIAKGLDFPGLNLVGLVLADVGFNLPDFRSTERAFQLITQVSGRAGRHVEGENVGTVIVQTYNPEHPGVTFSVNHDFEGFAQQELQARQSLCYPPYGRLASLRIQGQHKTDVMHAAFRVRQRGLQLKETSPRYSQLEILGPVEAPLFKLRGKFRYHLLLKGQDAATIGGFCTQLCANFQKQLKGVKLNVDVDPYNML